MSFNFEKYIGIPFVEYGRSFKGVDCYGLVWLAFKEELGIELPDYDERVFGRDWKGASRGHFLENVNQCWEIVSGSVFHLFDCHIFHDDEGIDSHIGFHIGSSKFLHCLENQSAMVGKLEVWKSRLVETVRARDAESHIQRVYRLFQGKA